MVELSQIREGMEVLGSDGQRLGSVKNQVPGDCFRVDCRRAPDLYIPIHAVDRLDGGQVVLKVTAARATNMGWELRPK